MGWFQKLINFLFIYHGWEGRGNGIIEKFKSTHFTFKTYNTIKYEKKLFYKNTTHGFRTALHQFSAAYIAASRYQRCPSVSNMFQGALNINTLILTKPMKKGWTFKTTANWHFRLLNNKLLWCGPRLVSYVVYIKVYIFPNILPRFTLLNRFT